MGDRRQVMSLYYITHVNNIPSILERGVLSHELVKAEAIQYTPIYDEDIISARKDKTTPDGKSLWSYANFYFQPRNPMLFRVTCERPINTIAILALRADVLNQQGALVTDGNAASRGSKIFSESQLREVLSGLGKDLHREWWTEEDGSKRKIMAEVLVPDKAPPEFIESIYVANHEVRDKVKELIAPSSREVIPEPKMFFEPPRKIDLTNYLSVLEGDLFFSRLQTLTVSVNVVGIMGKGLASRAKYQFPGVYVHYQDLCRNKTLQMGKPYLYKRESSLDLQLADEPEKLTNANSETWFLLFPTKRHWRENADMNGIRKGLEWLQETYKKKGMKSLAIPALGCGLGRLKWEEAGPVLCRFLSSLEIPVQLYLPAERKIDDKFLSAEYLLGRQDISP